MSRSTGRPAEAGLPVGRATDTVLAVRDVSKSYGPVRALQGASIDVAAGQVHALVGENGSGKSTLVGAVSGTMKPDHGLVAINGTSCTQHVPWESQRLGALTVFQDGSILADLTVAQNLYLGSRPGDRPAYRAARAWAADRLREAGLAWIQVDALASSLSPADRQLLEIARAVMARPALLVLDEATSALDPDGVDVALGLMRRVAQEGGAVLFVTHRLSEVFRVAEKVSVLRDGVSEGTYDIGDVDASGLVDLMAGTSVDIEFPTLASEDDLGPVLLAADGVAGQGYGAVTAKIRAGEIVGIAGAADNGQQQLLRGLAGVDPHQGTVAADGRLIASHTDAVRAGVAYLPRDRRNESLMGSLSIRENLVVGILGSLSRLGWIRPAREAAATSEAAEKFAIRMGSREDSIDSLSGGNQQKVALARVLATSPDVLLVDEPTIGVDVRSRKDIYGMLRSATQDKRAVVVVSSDASELAGLCDRILVLSRGRVVAELDGASASEDQIVRAFATGAHALTSSEPTVDDVVAEATAPDGSTGPRRFIRSHPDLVRLTMLSLLIVAIAAYVQSRNSLFLSELGIANVLIVALPLVTVAFAQYLIMFVGGMDISVGGTVGVTVVVMSYLVTDGSLATSLTTACVIAVVLGVAVGMLNWALVEKIHVSPIIATIATLSVMQGLALRLRPVPDGVIDVDLTLALSKQVGPVPLVLVVIAAVLVVGDRFLRSTGQGLRLRATGLNPQFAYRLGVDVPRLRQLAYVSCAVVAAFAGVLVSAQVGIGDPTVGNQYILLAIAAPILGGASLAGGRGLATGCLLGALLLAITQSMPTVLGLGDGVGILAAGALTLVPLLIYADGTTRAFASGMRRLRRQ